MSQNGSHEGDMEFESNFAFVFWILLSKGFLRAGDLVSMEVNKQPQELVTNLLFSVVFHVALNRYTCFCWSFPYADIA